MLIYLVRQLHSEKIFILLSSKEKAEEYVRIYTERVINNCRIELSRDPDNLTMLNNLSMAYKVLGNKTESKRWRDKYMSYPEEERKQYREYMWDSLFVDEKLVKDDFNKESI